MPRGSIEERLRRRSARIPLLRERFKNAHEVTGSRPSWAKSGSAGEYFAHSLWNSPSHSTGDYKIWKNEVNFYSPEHALYLTTENERQWGEEVAHIIRENPGKVKKVIEFYGIDWRSNSKHTGRWVEVLPYDDLSSTTAEAPENEYEDIKYDEEEEEKSLERSQGLKEPLKEPSSSLDWLKNAIAEGEKLKEQAPSKELSDLIQRSITENNAAFKKLLEHGPVPTLPVSQPAPVAQPQYQVPEAFQRVEQAQPVSQPVSAPVAPFKKIVSAIQKVPSAVFQEARQPLQMRQETSSVPLRGRRDIAEPYKDREVLSARRATIGVPLAEFRRRREHDINDIMHGRYNIEKREGIYVLESTPMTSLAAPSKPQAMSKKRSAFEKAPTSFGERGTFLSSPAVVMPTAIKRTSDKPAEFAPTMIGSNTFNLNKASRTQKPNFAFTKVERDYEEPAQEPLLSMRASAAMAEGMGERSTALPVMQGRRDASSVAVDKDYFQRLEDIDVPTWSPLGVPGGSEPSEPGEPDEPDDDDFRKRLNEILGVQTVASEGRNVNTEEGVKGEYLKMGFSEGEYDEMTRRSFQNSSRYKSSNTMLPLNVRQDEFIEPDVAYSQPVAELDLSPDLRRKVRDKDSFWRSGNLLSEDSLEEMRKREAIGYSSAIGRNEGDVYRDMDREIRTVRKMKESYEDDMPEEEAIKERYDKMVSRGWLDDDRAAYDPARYEKSTGDIDAELISNIATENDWRKEYVRWEQDRRLQRRYADLTGPGLELPLGIHFEDYMTPRAAYSRPIGDVELRVKSSMSEDVRSRIEKEKGRFEIEDATFEGTPAERNELRRRYAIGYEHMPIAKRNLPLSEPVYKVAPISSERAQEEQAMRRAAYREGEIVEHQERKLSGYYEKVNKETVLPLNIRADMYQWPASVYSGSPSGLKLSEAQESEAQLLERDLRKKGDVSQFEIDEMRRRVAIGYKHMVTRADQELPLTLPAYDTAPRRHWSEVSEENRPIFAPEDRFKPWERKQATIRAQRDAEWSDVYGDIKGSGALEVKEKRDKVFNKYNRIEEIAFGQHEGKLSTDYGVARLSSSSGERQSPLIRRGEIEKVVNPGKRYHAFTEGEVRAQEPGLQMYYYPDADLKVTPTESHALQTLIDNAPGKFLSEGKISAHLTSLRTPSTGEGAKGLDDISFNIPQADKAYASLSAEVYQPSELEERLASIMKPERQKTYRQVESDWLAKSEDSVFGSFIPSSTLPILDKAVENSSLYPTFDTKWDTGVKLPQNMYIYSRDYNENTPIFNAEQMGKIKKLVPDFDKNFKERGPNYWSALPVVDRQPGYELIGQATSTEKRLPFSQRTFGVLHSDDVDKALHDYNTKASFENEKRAYGPEEVEFTDMDRAKELAEKNYLSELKYNKDRYLPFAPRVYKGKLDDAYFDMKESDPKEPERVLSLAKRVTELPEEYVAAEVGDELQTAIRYADLAKESGHHMVPYPAADVMKLEDFVSNYEYYNKSYHGTLPKDFSILSKDYNYLTENIDRRAKTDVRWLNKIADVKALASPTNPGAPNSRLSNLRKFRSLYELENEEVVQIRANTPSSRRFRDIPPPSARVRGDADAKLDDRSYERLVGWSPGDKYPYEEYGNVRKYEFRENIKAKKGEKVKSLEEIIDLMDKTPAGKSFTLVKRKKAKEGIVAQIAREEQELNMDFARDQELRRRFHQRYGRGSAALLGVSDDFFGNNRLLPVNRWGRPF
jgi:hypothetical protein